MIVVSVWTKVVTVVVTVLVIPVLTSRRPRQAASSALRGRLLDLAVLLASTSFLKSVLWSAAS